jgi:thioredoxin 1
MAAAGGTWYWSQPSIYPAGVDARVEIRQAEQDAAKKHKRILLVFGANWCYDCHVLDRAFRHPEVASVLAENYELVHVDVGAGDKNQDLMKEYGVPMEQGIPAIAILESDGRPIYSQKNGEFENARRLTPEVLVVFLSKWKVKTS